MTTLTKNSTTADLASAIEYQIYCMEEYRTKAIGILQEYLLRDELYSEDPDVRDSARRKADDYAYSLGGYVAAEDQDMPLRFWSES